MNALELAGLLGDLPDDMIVSANTGTCGRTIAESARSAEGKAAAATLRQTDQTVRKKTDISAPHWMTAAALAACLLFAVGAAAVLLYRKQDDLTVQHSQADSLLEEMTTVSGTATTGTDGVTGTTAIPADSGILFTEIAADYRDDERFLPRDSMLRLKPCIIRSTAQLKQNPVQPAAPLAEEFFEENALIFISAVFANTSSRLPAVTELQLQGNTLRIRAERGLAEDEAEQWWCSFLAVSRKALADTDEHTAIDLDITETDGSRRQKTVYISEPAPPQTGTGTAAAAANTTAETQTAKRSAGETTVRTAPSGTETVSRTAALTASGTSVTTAAETVTTTAADDGIPQIDVPEGGAYEWRSNGTESPLRIRLSVAPETVFTWEFHASGEHKTDLLSAETDGRTIQICSGEPLRNIFFSDISGDGVPEICISSEWREINDYGLPETLRFVFVYDPVSQQQYQLGDRLCRNPDGTSDYDPFNPEKAAYLYSLHDAQGRLKVTRTLHMLSFDSRIPTVSEGSLRLEDSQLIFIPEPEA